MPANNLHETVTIAVITGTYGFKVGRAATIATLFKLSPHTPNRFLLCADVDAEQYVWHY
jgi:hypothetical protein